MRNIQFGQITGPEASFHFFLFYLAFKLLDCKNWL